VCRIPFTIVIINPADMKSIQSISKKLDFFIVPHHNIESIDLRYSPELGKPEFEGE